MFKIGTQSGEKLELGGSWVGVRGDDDDAALDSGCGVRHGGAGGDGGGDLEGEEAFATAVVTVEEGDASKGDAILPEPADGLW